MKLFLDSEVFYCIKIMDIFQSNWLLIYIYYKFIAYIYYLLILYGLFIDFITIFYITEILYITKIYI